MDLEAPRVITDVLPEGVRAYAWYILGGSVCVVLLFGFAFLGIVARLLFGRRREKSEFEKKLVETLTEYPDLKSSTGDRQLRAEGVPVRMRLIVVAPAGTTTEVDLDELEKVLNDMVMGLGEIYKHDRPRVKAWPKQVSYQGFGNLFHQNMDTGAKEKEPTRWILIAGRVKVGKRQIMLGMALQSIKENTVGRRTVDAHEWAQVLRVRVKD